MRVVERQGVEPCSRWSLAAFSSAPTPADPRPTCCVCIQRVLGGSVGVSIADIRWSGIGLRAYLEVCLDDHRGDDRDGAGGRDLDEILSVPDLDSILDEML